MSGGNGFLPDLASWALRGGAGDNNSDQNNENAEEASPAGPQLSEQEMRARRLARMEALQQEQEQNQQPVPMDVDKPAAPTKQSTAPKKAPPNPLEQKPPAKVTKAPPRKDSPEQKKKKARENPSPSEPARKVQRKRELLLKRILLVSLTGTSSTSDSSCVVLDIEESTITVQTIAEVLATRLALPPGAPELRTTPQQKPLIAYLGQCHRRASEELKNIKQSNKSKNNDVEDILEEIKGQVVSYAASSLMEPDLFELAKDGTTQLAKCLTTVSTDISSSITFGVTGSSSSFFHCLCDELLSQDKSAFERVVAEVASYLSKNMTKCDSVLEGGTHSEDSALTLVSALTALCGHKKAAEAVTNMPTFLLPAAGTPEAQQLIRPPLPSRADLLRMLAGERPYLRRSGPALEKETVLGLALRVGCPKDNPSFSPTTILRQSLDSVERSTSQQRRQLRVYQEACNQLVVALVKAGPDARNKVMRWFVDALLVNTGATALRPDPTKVSSSPLLLNMSVVFLKLCEPFVVDDRKKHLIDPGFVTSPSDHGGVFATSGDDLVPRLGENTDAMSDYSPKNSFIPQCFFFAARALHLGIVPLLSYHENLLRHISHTHWELTSQNRDLQSDPHFCILVSRQRSSEVALFQDEMVADTLRFCNLMARVLYEMDDDTLRLMPEHFVDNVCDIIMSIAKMKARLLSGLQFRYVFKLVVKLLSSKYASMVRNYNLRAMLGDVLYELYLPSDFDDNREVPASLSRDPLHGGQTYLLSDKSAQETLAPSLLLLYGEVEHTGYYDKMSHRAKIASLLKYLWESSEHRPAFRSITQNKESFIKFANGIMNETNTLIATVMQKLPEIREAQEKMKNTQEWGKLSDDEKNVITSRLDDNEREVKHALPLCNKTLQMFGYLNTDGDIRKLFLLEELCRRLVAMLLHVLTKLVGSKGLDLKVDNPDQYEFRPKEMLRDLCAIFALFASSSEFQVECAKSGCNPDLLRSAVKTCRRLNLLTGESMSAFDSLPGLVEEASRKVAEDEALLTGAPDEFLDEILSTFMQDPVILPSGHIVDRSTITQHLLNDPIDPFNREEMTIDDVKPATELKERMTKWLQEKRSAKADD